MTEEDRKALAFQARMIVANIKCALATVEQIEPYPPLDGVTGEWVVDT